ncbi:MAG: hypothetical protein GY711_03995 [bacterium]|nr:hypothetical protein [bacterium]
MIGFSLALSVVGAWVLSSASRGDEALVPSSGAYGESRLIESIAEELEQPAQVGELVTDRQEPVAPVLELPKEVVERLSERSLGELLEHEVVVRQLLAKATEGKYLELFQRGEYRSHAKLTKDLLYTKDKRPIPTAVHHKAGGGVDIMQLSESLEPEAWALTAEMKLTEKLIQDKKRAMALAEQEERGVSGQ